MTITFALLQAASAVYNQGTGAEWLAFKLAIKNMLAAEINTNGCSLTDYIMGTNMGGPHGPFRAPQRRSTNSACCATAARTEPRRC